MEQRGQQPQGHGAAATKQRRALPAKGPEPERQTRRNQPARCQREVGQLAFPHLAGEQPSVENNQKKPDYREGLTKHNAPV